MDNPRASVALSALIIAIVVALIGLSWISYTVASSSTSGESFLTYWTSTRAFLKSGSQPYDPEIQNQVQQEADKRSLPLTVQQEWLAFPIYLEAFVLPFALTAQYPLARIAWMVFLEVCAILVVWASVRAAGWENRLFAWPALICFSMLWFFSVRTFITGNISVVVALLIAFALWALKESLDELAGILLALATIQPGAVLLLVVFTLIWSISARRWRLFIWLSGGILLLCGFSSLFAPNWILEYIRQLFHSYPSSEILTPQSVFVIRYPGIGSRLGMAFSTIVAVVLLIEWWLARGKDFSWYYWTACLTLTLTPWIGIPLHLEYMVILLVPLVLVFATLEEAWGMRIRWITVLLMLILLVSFWIPFLSNLSQVFLSGRPAFMFTLPAVVFIGLYWIRWRSTRPRRLLISELKAREI